MLNKLLFNWLFILHQNRTLLCQRVSTQAELYSLELAQKEVSRWVR